MPAPNLQTLLDVETEVERAFTTYLTGTLQLPAIGSDSDEDLQTPRIEATATLLRDGPQVHQQTTGTYAGRYFWVQKFVRVSLDLVYSPAWGQDKGSLRGLLGAALSDADGIAAEFATNGYYLPAKATLIQTDGDRSADGGEKTIRLNTTLEFQAWMNKDAIPA